MDIVRLRIPYKFIRERIRISWPEMRFGLANELLDSPAPVELALDRIAETAEPSAALLEVASALRDTPTLELVEQIACDAPSGLDDEVRDLWLYLVLAWVYEHRDEYPDSLQSVEEIYADFGYPEQIAHFVRYMPMDGPDLGNRESNEGRLFKRWKQYLDKVGPALASSPNRTRTAS